MRKMKILYNKKEKLKVKEKNQEQKAKRPNRFNKEGVENLGQYC